MTWESKTFPEKAARAFATPPMPDGRSRTFVAGPLPRRESFFAVSSAEDWDAVERDLAEYWAKVAEVLPRYYAARGAADPLAGEPVSPDAGWDRLVFILDSVYGKVTTNLWAGDRRPRTVDRVWVIATFPMVERLAAGGEKSDAIIKRMRTALVWAGERPEAVEPIARLWAWREMSFWVMDAEEPETLRPMFPS